MGHNSDNRVKRRARKRRKASRVRQSLRLSLREKLLSLSLFVFSSFALVQMGTAQGENSDSAVPAYSDARQLWSERAADNFPGSAFYYLAEDGDWLATNAAGNAGTTLIPGAGNITASAAIGPFAASAFRLGGSTRDRYRALQCLTTAIYYEAALEPDAGQRAVAQVVLNRVRHPSYPANICGVVYQGSERATGCQFTFSCDGSMARRPDPYHWKRARLVASDMLDGAVFAPAGLATHYHTTEVSPYWAPSLNFLGTIGAHRFYSWKGSAGLPAAFSGIYAGNEPSPGPKPKQAITRASATTDPVALARAYEAAIAQSQQVAAANAADKNTSQKAPAASAQSAPPRYSEAARAKGGDANYRAQNLPGASTIRPEYRDSGRWIAEPGKR
ncbi:MAG: cell wall hydrolase [Pseudomonadota bacterium]